MQSTVSMFRLTASHGNALPRGRGGDVRQVAAPKGVKALPAVQVARRAIPMDDAKDQQALARF